MREPTGLRIGIYYLILGLLAAFAIWQFPAVSDLVTPDILGDPAVEGEITRTMAGGVPLSSPVTTGWEGVLVTLASLLGALLISIPVAWTYTLIKRRMGYAQSVVHTLLILPVVVTGVVIVVKGSLALAFSLAGIVAAVRFRTTLDDTKDAVFVFMAIGVGLAAGVQALGVAAALSVVFNVVNLVLWKLNFGNVYVDQMGRLGLGEALAGPGSAKPGAVFGDSRLMEAMGPRDLQEVAERQARLDQHLRDEASTRKERKRFSVLMVYTDQVARAQPVVEQCLAELTLRWTLTEIVPGKDEVSAMEYLVRLRDDATESGLVQEIRSRAGDTVKAAELRSLKAFKRG